MRCAHYNILVYEDATIHASRLVTITITSSLNIKLAEYFRGKKAQPASELVQISNSNLNVPYPTTLLISVNICFSVVVFLIVID